MEALGYRRGHLAWSLDNKAFEKENLQAFYPAPPNVQTLHLWTEVSLSLESSAKTRSSDLTPA